MKANKDVNVRVMKKTTFLYGIVVILLIMGSIERTHGACVVKPTVLSAGERVTYQLYYNLGFIWVNAGTADLRIKKSSWNQQAAWQLSLIGKTDPSFDGFFSVRDTMITYIDSSTLIPFKSYKYTHEDAWHGIDVFTFGPNSAGYKVTTQLMRKGAWKPTQEDETTECGFDILTSMYRLRCLEGLDSFKAGKKMEVSIRLDDGEYKVYMTYLGIERVKLHKTGSFQAHAITLSLVAGKVFKRGDVLKMWISTDGNNIPLLIESPIRVGKIKVVYKEAQNTRYPAAKAIR